MIGLNSLNFGFWTAKKPKEPANGLSTVGTWADNEQA
jgi:hypothetical protein